MSTEQPEKPSSPPNVLELSRVFAFILMAAVELRRLFCLIFFLLFADSFLLSRVSGQCFGDSLREVLAWSFGNGADLPGSSGCVFSCLIFAGFLGYVLLGLILAQVTTAVSHSLGNRPADLGQAFRWFLTRWKPKKK